MKNFMAPAKLLARLRELSEKKDVSESEIIRKALECYITDAEKGVCPSGIGYAALRGDKQ